MVPYSLLSSLAIFLFPIVTTAVTDRGAVEIVTITITRQGSNCSLSSSLSTTSFAIGGVNAISDISTQSAINASQSSNTFATSAPFSDISTANESSLQPTNPGSASSLSPTSGLQPTISASEPLSTAFGSSPIDGGASGSSSNTASFSTTPSGGASASSSDSVLLTSTSTNGASGSSSPTIPISSTPTTGTFNLRRDVENQYAYLVPGAKRDTSGVTYNVGFTASLAQAANFSLDSNSHLVTGDYIAEIDQGATNVLLRFASPEYVRQNNLVPAICQNASTDTINCQAQTNNRFYVCDDGYLSIGSSPPNQCYSAVLYRDESDAVPSPSSTLSSSNTLGSSMAGSATIGSTTANSQSAGPIGSSLTSTSTSTTITSQRTSSGGGSISTSLFSNSGQSSSSRVSSGTTSAPGTILSSSQNTSSASSGSTPSSDTISSGLGANTGTSSGTGAHSNSISPSNLPTTTPFSTISTSPSLQASGTTSAATKTSSSGDGVNSASASAPGSSLVTSSGSTGLTGSGSSAATASAVTTATGTGSSALTVPTSTSSAATSSLTSSVCSTKPPYSTDLSIPCGSSQIFSLLARTCYDTVDDTFAFLGSNEPRVPLSLGGYSSQTTAYFNLDSSCHLVVENGSIAGAAANLGASESDSQGGNFLYFSQPADFDRDNDVAATCQVAGGLLSCSCEGNSNFSVSSGQNGGYVLLGNGLGYASGYYYLQLNAILSSMTSATPSQAAASSTIPPAAATTPTSSTSPSAAASSTNGPAALSSTTTSGAASSTSPHAAASSASSIAAASSTIPSTSMTSSSTAAQSTTTPSAAAPSTTCPSAQNFPIPCDGSTQFHLQACTSNQEVVGTYAFFRSGDQNIHFTTELPLAAIFVLTQEGGDCRLSTNGTQTRDSLACLSTTDTTDSTLYFEYSNNDGYNYADCSVQSGVLFCSVGTQSYFASCPSYNDVELTTADGNGCPSLALYVVLVAQPPAPGVTATTSTATSISSTTSSSTAAPTTSSSAAASSTSSSAAASSTTSAAASSTTTTSIVATPSVSQAAASSTTTVMAASTTTPAGPQTETVTVD